MHILGDRLGQLTTHRKAWGFVRGHEQLKYYLAIARGVKDDSQRYRRLQSASRRVAVIAGYIKTLDPTDGKTPSLWKHLRTRGDVREHDLLCRLIAELVAGHEDLKPEQLLKLIET